MTPARARAIAGLVKTLQCLEVSDRDALGQALVETWEALGGLKARFRRMIELENGQ